MKGWLECLLPTVIIFINPLAESPHVSTQATEDPYLLRPQKYAQVFSACFMRYTKKWEKKLLV